MTQDARFGLPLSLLEALRADPSPAAAGLAELIEAQEAPARRRSWNPQPWQAVLTGLALSVGLGAQSYGADLASLQGRWEMSPARSSFKEAVTGPAPDAPTLVVTRDDAQRLVYQLVERRDGTEVGRGAYDISFAGASSTSSVDGAELPVTASRDAKGAVTISAPPIAGRQASIRVRRTGPDTAVLEHDIASAQGVLRLETIALVRAQGKGEDQ